MNKGLTLAIRWAVVIVVALPFMPVAGRAQGPSSTLPTDVTIDDVLRLLETRSPRTQAERATIDVAAADRITARTLPNPTINYGAVHLVEGFSTGAITAHQLDIEQPLLLFGQRQTRTDAADASVKAEEARVAEALADRRFDVRRAFATLLSRQSQLQIVQDSLLALEHVTQLVRGRAAAGDRSQYDLLRIETETASLRVEAMNAATNVEETSGELAGLLGLPGWQPHALGTLAVGAVPTDVDTLWKTAQERRPAIVALRAQQVAARAGVTAAIRERLPIPAFSAGTQTTNQVSGTSVVIGLSQPLALFDRNQGAIARAQAQVRASELAIAARLEETRAEIESRANVLSKRRAALDILDRDVMLQLPTLRRMAEDAYREGSADILELLDANRSLRELQLARVQQLEAVKLAEEDVIAAAGLEGATR